LALFNSPQHFGLWLLGPFAVALRANHVQMENLNV
jgi:hypothetical protein